MLYSATTGGFYNHTIHGDNIPADAVEISDADYAAMLEAQVSGKQIQPGLDGFPMAVDPPALTAQQIEDLRLQAYADATTGSDRYFAEVLRLQVMGGPDEEIEAARSAGVARYLEIQALYPWPDDPAHQPQ